MISQFKFKTTRFLFNVIKHTSVSPSLLKIPVLDTNIITPVLYPMLHMQQYSSGMYSQIVAF